MASLRRTVRLPLAFVVCVLVVASVAATPGVAVGESLAAAAPQDPSDVEASLALGRSTRRLIQQGLRNEGFHPGTPDGLFGPRTRAAIRDWQQSRRESPTGYLNAAQAELLRAAARPALAPPGVSSDLPTTSAAPPVPDPVASEAENLFWQSIMNSTAPAEFEAYLEQFPNGMFRTLAQVRLAAATQQRRADAEAERRRVEAEAERNRLAELRSSPGTVFRDCEVCPEMVVLAAGRVALGRFEVTVGEYRAFVAATGRGPGARCSWRDPGFPQTDRHPTTCLSWEDAQAYVLWLSRTTGSRYRLPTETEWDSAAARTQPGCHQGSTGTLGTCPVGSYGPNDAGLFDMVGNVAEFTQDCFRSDCETRATRGGSWATRVRTGNGPWRIEPEYLRPAARVGNFVYNRFNNNGLRVLRPLE